MKARKERARDGVDDKDRMDWNDKLCFRGFVRAAPLFDLPRVPSICSAARITGPHARNWLCSDCRMTKESSMKPANPRILTINGGSSSIKFALFEAGDSLQRILEGGIERLRDEFASGLHLS
jgi:hypothetical protein